jgi:hypothetical protein
MLKDLNEMQHPTGATSLMGLPLQPEKRTNDEKCVR